VINAKVKPHEIEIRAVVRRADGTVEDLGRVSYYHKNPILRWWRSKRCGGLAKV
jgi:hypothetical protein